MEVIVIDQTQLPIQYIHLQVKSVVYIWLNCYWSFFIRLELHWSGGIINKRKAIQSLDCNIMRFIDSSHFWRQRSVRRSLGPFK